MCRFHSRDPAPEHLILLSGAALCPATTNMCGDAVPGYPRLSCLSRMFNFSSRWPAGNFGSSRFFSSAAMVHFDSALPYIGVNMKRPVCHGLA